MNTFERFWCCWLFLRAIKTNKNSVFKSIYSFIIQLIKVSFLFWPFLVFLQSFLAVPAGQAIECIFFLPFEASGSAVQWLHQRRCELWKKKCTELILLNKSAITYLFLILFLSPLALELSALSLAATATRSLMNSLTFSRLLSRCETQVWMQKVSPAF